MYENTSVAPAEAGSIGFFAPINKRFDCGYCNGRFEPSTLTPHIDAVICISTQDNPDRTRQAADHFHQTGLCRDVVFYRPKPGRHIPRAIWVSHRAVACYALAQGFRRVVILEDDATFRRPWPLLVPRLAKAIDKLPQDWWGFYLGHWPLQGYFVRPNILRVRSGCAHAYLAGPQLLRWLATTEPMDANVPVWRVISASIDGALANLPGMYALFPMIATQRFMGEHRIDIHPRFTPEGKPRKLMDKARYREFIIFRCMRLAEILVVILSPLHWLMMRRSSRVT